MGFSFNDLCSNLLPSGRVKAQVTDIKFKVSPTGEASNDIVVNYTIAEGASAKRVLTDTLYEKAASFRLKPFLVACKVDMNRQFATKEELYQFGLKEAKGKFIMIDIGVKTYNGKQYNEITNYYPLPDSSTTADEALAEFGASEVKTESVIADVKEDALPESLGGSVEDMPSLDIDESTDSPF